MAKTFGQMASEAMAAVPAVSPEEAQRRIAENPDTLIIDVLDLADRRALGQPIGAVPISAGMLAVRADQELPAEWTDARLQDRSRPVITICATGELSAIGARTLQEMGFENVAYVAGGTVGWREAGLPTEQPQD